MENLRNFFCILLVSFYCSVALSQPISNVECPDTTGSNLVLISDPYDCSKFYMCGPNGQPIHMSCPNGLYFNPKLDVCDFPDNVECHIITTEIISTTKTTETPHYNMTTNYTPNYNETTTTFPQHNVTTAGPYHNVSTTGPQHNVTTTGPQQNVTTTGPQNNVTTTGPQHNVTTTGPQQNVTTTGPQHNVTVISTSSPALNSSTDQSLNTTTQYVKTHGISASPECPSTSGSDLVLFPDPSDCGSYYMCITEGSAIHMSCPTGLYFNPVLQVCDYPENVECIIDNITTSPGPSKNVTTPQYSTYRPNNNATTWSPVNVSTFAPISSTSTPTPDITPSLPLSNTTSSINSDNSTLTISPILNSTVLVTTSSSNSSSHSTGSANYAVTAPPTIASQCPPFSPYATPFHLSNPQDCSSFYTCVSDNTAFLQYCQTGLQFNAIMQICDFPHNVNC